MNPDLDLGVHIFAGLGLFFVGLKLLSNNLKGLAGRQFKRLVGRVSGHPLVAAAGGVAAGLVTQSGRVAAFLLGGLAQAGLLEPRAALPLVAWANFGCTLMVFIAVLPLHEAIMLLVGWAGVTVAFNYPPKWQTVNQALFGAALLLFGLDLMTTAAGGFAQRPWFAEGLAVFGQAPLLAFGAGLLLTLLAQSHMAIILIALALASAGLFGFEAAVMVVFGAHAGSSLVTYLLSASFQGAARQVVMAQVSYNLAGLAVFVPLFWLDEVSGAQLLRRGVGLFTGDAGGQAAGVALLFNFFTPLTLALAAGPWSRWLARRWPPSERETLARPQFLQDQALDEPQTALLLVEKEQQRLAGWLPGHLGAARDGAEPAARQAQHEAFAEVDTQMGHYFAELLHRALPVETTERVINLQNRQEHLRALENCAWEMLQCCRGHGADAGDGVGEVALRLLEGFDTQLLTLNAVLRDGDAEELALLRAMTSDRGEAMENLRRVCLADGVAATTAARRQLLHVTNLFERGAWTLSRYAELLAAAHGRKNGGG